MLMETKTQPEMRKPGTGAMIAGAAVTALSLVLWLACLMTGEAVFFAVVLLFMGLGALVFGFAVRLLNAVER